MKNGEESDFEKNKLKEELDSALAGGAGPKIARFALACLSGAIPIAGGVIGAAGGAWSEAEQDQFNKIFAAWLKLQEDEIKEIGQTLFEVFARIDQSDQKVRTRLESKEYLALLKKCFRDWSAAESEEMRARPFRCVARLGTQAPRASAGTAPPVPALARGACVPRAAAAKKMKEAAPLLPLP